MLGMLKIKEKIMSQTIQNQEVEAATTHEPTLFMKPNVDIYETTGEDEALVLVADLPGITKEELSIQFHDGELTIEGKRPKIEGETLFSEFRANGFKRSFSIHEKLDVDNITAEIQDGILTVRMPKSPELKARTIHINA